MFFLCEGQSWLWVEPFPGWSSWAVDTGGGSWTVEYINSLLSALDCDVMCLDLLMFCHQDFLAMMGCDLESWAQETHCPIVFFARVFDGSIRKGNWDTGHGAFDLFAPGSLGRGLDQSCFPLRIRVIQEAALRKEAPRSPLRQMRWLNEMHHQMHLSSQSSPSGLLCEPCKAPSSC